MTSAWENCHIGCWYIDPRHLRWALQRFADLYGIILTPVDDRRAFDRGAALRDIFHGVADPNGQVIALHPEAGGTQSLIGPPHGMGAYRRCSTDAGCRWSGLGRSRTAGASMSRSGPALKNGALDGLSDAQSAERVMPAIAELLPARSCGYMQIQSSR